MSAFKISPEFEGKVREAVSAPNARPEFVNQLRNELARRPVKMKPMFIFRPAWAIAFALALAVIAMDMDDVMYPGDIKGFLKSTELNWFLFHGSYLICSHEFRPQTCSIACSRER